MKLLLYCTKNKWRLFFDRVKQVFTLGKVKSNNDLNGKIVAECDFDVEEIEKVCVGIFKYCYRTKTLDEYDFMFKTQLNGERMKEYLQGNGYANHKGYAIHIKNLNIFDEPRELNDYYKIEDVGGMLFTKPLTKAPQNMMRVSVNHWNYATYNPDDIRILISIQPQWMCLILNRIKDVEVRKVVLKEMLKNENE